MNNTKIRKKPRSKHRIRQSKKRLAKLLKAIKKKSRISNNTAENCQESDVSKLPHTTPQGLRTYHPRGEIHPYSYALRKHKWMGLLTLKLHDRAYSMDDSHRVGQKNRFEFLKLVMKNLCNRKFRVKESELNWFACQEFGISGQGHVHVIFSFDHLKAKARADKIPKIDFSEERGEFFNEVLETVNTLWMDLGKSAQSVDLDWSPMWENDGLVSYYCKLEDGREDKEFIFSKYWEIHQGLKAS
jgi:hypothetical protein